MNKLYASCFIFIVLFSTPSLFAQHNDCQTALEPCGASPIYFEPDLGIGLADPGIENTCVFQEFNSKWIKWNVLEDGIITFVLTPDSADQDLDFVVFHSGSDYDCNNKTLIRCMASGANVGQPPNEWAHCTGPTGLSVGETDIEEMAGCLASDNNFLAPIEAFAGDHFIMLVNEFSNLGLGYTLSFGGTAVLDCISVSTNPYEEKLHPTFVVTPTLSTGTIYVSLAGGSLTDTDLMVFNMTGQNVYSKNHLNGMVLQVDLPHLTPGTYLAVLRTNNTILTKKFLITK